MKKGRHRRFEEARKLKQSGPEAFGGIRAPRVRQPHSHRETTSTPLSPRSTASRSTTTTRTTTTARPWAVAARAAIGCHIVNHPPLRNVALVAHVDHGKTTLVDALLRATGVFGAHQAPGRAGHGLQRPGARAGHHDPGQGRLDRVAGRAHQPRRHPGPRRLRRRGRAGAGHGRRRAAARRRGRGSAAPDPLRAVEGARPRAARRGRDQQGRPRRRPRRTRSSTRSSSSSSTSATDADQLGFPVVSAVAREGRTVARRRRCRPPTPT